MIKQYKGQLFVECELFSDGGYWEDCGSGIRMEQDAAFDDVMKSLAINEEGHYQNITKTRVVTRTVSDWETVAEGVVM